MNAYYPASSNNIFHKGKNGNTYVLDGIQKLVNIANKYKSENKFSVKDISFKNIDIAKAENIINNVHNPKILIAYKTGKPLELAESAGVMWQPKIYEHVIENAILCEQVVDEALTYKKALAVLGGGHHAEKDTPFGFCLINTMAISALYAVHKGLSVSIIDLDTHYSNGCFDILHNNPNVNVYSIWNQKLDKWKDFAVKGNIWHKFAKDADDYFEHLAELASKIKSNPTDLVIYHLGLDVLDSDRMGGIKGMTPQKAIERDTKMSQLLKDLAIPFVIFLGGGYIDWSKGPDYASAQRESLTNLFCNNIDLFD